MAPQLVEFLQLGTAAAVVIILLRMIFNFIKQQKGTVIQPVDTLEQSSENNELLRTMSIQITEMYDTLQVTKEFQRAFNAIVDSQAKQVKILTTLTALSKQNTELLQYIVKKTEGKG